MSKIHDSSLEEVEDSALFDVACANNDVVYNRPRNQQEQFMSRTRIEVFYRMLQDASGSGPEVVDTINEEGLQEHFIDGVYIRELLIPKEHIVTSRIWKKERLWIIAQGEATFALETGTQRIRAPFTKVIPPFTRAAIYTHADTLWFAVTRAEAMNHEDVEKEVIVDTKDEQHQLWRTDK